MTIRIGLYFACAISIALTNCATSPTEPTIATNASVVVDGGGRPRGFSSTLLPSLKVDTNTYSGAGYHSITALDLLDSSNNWVATQWRIYGIVRVVDTTGDLGYSIWPNGVSIWISNSHTTFPNSSGWAKLIDAESFGPDYSETIRISSNGQTNGSFDLRYYNRTFTTTSPSLRGSLFTNSPTNNFVFRYDYSVGGYTEYGQSFGPGFLPDQLSGVIAPFQYFMIPGY